MMSNNFAGLDQADITRILSYLSVNEIPVTRRSQAQQEAYDDGLEFVTNNFLSILSRATNQHCGRLMQEIGEAGEESGGYSDEITGVELLRLAQEFLDTHEVPKAPKLPSLAGLQRGMTDVNRQRISVSGMLEVLAPRTRTWARLHKEITTMAAGLSGLKEKPADAMGVVGAGGRQYENLLRAQEIVEKLEIRLENLDAAFAHMSRIAAIELGTPSEPEASFKEPSEKISMPSALRRKK